MNGIMKKVKRDRRNAAILSLPFVFFIILSIAFIRGSMQFLLAFFFLSIFGVFFGMFLAYDGVLDYEKESSK